MQKGFYVTFTKVNGEIEEYFYWSESDARNHIELFADDDSGLYRKIALESEATGGIHEWIFPQLRKIERRI